MNKVTTSLDQKSTTQEAGCLKDRSLRLHVVSVEVSSVGILFTLPGLMWLHLASHF